MIRETSLVLSAAFPSSKSREDGLAEALAQIEPYGVACVEYYCEGCKPERVRSLLDGISGIFLAGARQKAMNLNPSSRDADVREFAVRQMEECFHFARETGARAVMMSSGTRPENERDDTECLKHLEDSIFRLHRTEPDLEILLEPGDRDVEYRHLVGPTPMAVALARKLRENGAPVGLLFDMSHVAQLGEELYQAWDAAKDVCGHVHLANCVLERESPIYGDKHPFFGVEAGVYSHHEARAFFSKLEEEPFPMTVGLEMICSELDEKEFFRRLAKDTSWFFDFKPLRKA